MVAISFNSYVSAEEQKQPADMSDPMAVFSQFGASAGTNGLNLKFVKALDTGVDDEMSMFALEAKNIMGSWTDDSGSSQDNPELADDGIDELRFRLFSVNTNNGLGSYIDVTHNVDDGMGFASYGLMQALPKVGFWQAYPILAGGVQYSDGELNRELVRSGIASDDEVGTGTGINSFYGQFIVYNKFTITDKIWLNYNLTYTHAIFGDDYWVDKLRDGDGLSHEFIASYQITPINNVRLYYSAGHESFEDGDWRLEYNHQF